MIAFRAIALLQAESDLRLEFPIALMLSDFDHFGAVAVAVSFFRERDAGIHPGAPAGDAVILIRGRRTVVVPAAEQAGHRLFVQSQVVIQIGH